MSKNDAIGHSTKMALRYSSTTILKVLKMSGHPLHLSVIASVFTTQLDVINRPMTTYPPQSLSLQSYYLDAASGTASKGVVVTESRISYQVAKHEIRNLIRHYLHEIHRAGRIRKVKPLGSNVTTMMTWMCLYSLARPTEMGKFSSRLTTHDPKSGARTCL